MPIDREKWLPLGEAAEQFSMSRQKLSRWVTIGRVRSEVAPPEDERVTLVSVEDLNKIFRKRKEDQC